MRSICSQRARTLATAILCGTLPFWGAGALADFAAAGQAWQEGEPVTIPPPEGEQARQWERTLAGIYELALRNDKTLAAAEASYRAGLEARVLGRAELLPSISAEYSYRDSSSESRGTQVFGSQEFQSDVDTDRTEHFWAVRLQQPLFDVPAWFRFRRGGELSEQAKTQFTQAQQDLIVRTAEAYFEVLRAMANLEASQAQEEAVAAQLEQAEQRFDVGLVAVTDVHEAQAAFDTARADRLGFEGDVEVALENLSVLTGRSHTDLWRLSDEFPVSDPTPAAVQDWVQFAREHNVDIRLAQQNRTIAEHNARAAFGEHLPTVNLSLSYQDSDVDGSQDDLNAPPTDPRQQFATERRDRQVAINVNMPIFAGGRISAGRRQADAELEGERQRFEAAVREVTQGTRASHISVRRNVSRNRAREQAIISSRSALEAAETGYEVGTRNIVDVLDAQRMLFSAIRDQANSRIDFVLDVVQLKRQAGVLTPADILELNQWLVEPQAPTASRHRGRNQGE